MKLTAFTDYSLRVLIYLAAQPGRRAIVECFGEGGGACRITGLCRLQGILGEAVSAFHAVLQRYTLADLVRNREALATVFLAGRIGAAHTEREET